MLRAYADDDAAREVSRPSAGGDTTLQIDFDFEQIIIEEVQRFLPEQRRVIVSEELGTVATADADNTEFVIIDPVDGSKNAAQGIAQFSLSVAVASGKSMADVWFGYVYDFGTNEEYVARHCGGPPLVNGRVTTNRRPPRYRLLACESAEPALLSPGLAALATSPVEEVRVIGSIAIGLSYLGLGRIEGFLTCKDCRSVDAAAAQLIARQGGCAVFFDGSPPTSASLDLAARYRLVAGRGELIPDLLAAQSAIPHVPR
jgi:myo-inositol-1(or 4)-monophosphatase